MGLVKPIGGRAFHSYAQKMKQNSGERCPLCLSQMSMRGGFWACRRCHLRVPTSDAPLTVDVAADGLQSSGILLAITETMVWMRLDDSGRTRWVQRSAIIRVESGLPHPPRVAPQNALSIAALRQNRSML